MMEEDVRGDEALALKKSNPALRKLTTDRKEKRREEKKPRMKEDEEDEEDEEAESFALAKNKPLLSVVPSHGRRIKNFSLRKNKVFSHKSLKTGCFLVRALGMVRALAVCR